ncbi:MAG: phenylalanine--tRNA ligase alpha subunit [Vicingaceae bacterium]|nr:MAG: phenylalanine--tRNA ligase alpha subunit [Vicingaceae bacterium]
MSLIKNIADLSSQALNEKINTAKDLEDYRIKWLGNNGIIKSLYAELKNIDPAHKKEAGKAINELRSLVEERIQGLKKNLDSTAQIKNLPDFTLKATLHEQGCQHPITIVTRKIIDIFKEIGFDVSTGPEIEDDWHNFSALNFPEDHPARDMQDTFFLKNFPLLLRTHTSSVQIRVMENQKPPIRTLSPGRVYRNEAISARAHCFFHQVEGLYVDKKVSFMDLKNTLNYFAKRMFGDIAQTRWRPSYFPFTEPSAEVDVSCTICNGKGCNVCKYSGWLEILGCGMVDPQVLNNCQIDTDLYSGFAFGMGVERIAQLLYRVSDIRMYSENDIRFLQKFKPSIL